MATTDFLPFGTGTGSNVLSQAAYAALAAVESGFESGILASENLNKVLRQGTVMAAALANVMVTVLTANVPDDGNLTNLEAQITAMINGLISAAITAQVPGLINSDVPPIISSQVPGIISSQVPGMISSQVPGIINADVPPIIVNSFSSAYSYTSAGAASSFWRVSPDGFVEQGGFVVGTGATGTTFVEVNYPIPFPSGQSAIPSVLLYGATGSPAAAYVTLYNDASKFGVELSGNFSFFWSARWH